MKNVAHAQVIRSYGDESRFEAATLRLPDALAAGSVRVAVAAAGVNPVDLTTRAGKNKNIPLEQARFPMVLGWDVAGTVIAIGDDVSDVHEGARVAAMTFQPMDQNGTYRSVIDLDAALLAEVPTGLDLEVAATIPLTGLTADQLVDRARVDAGKTVLINAPLGAVGRFVAQLAASRGARVIGIATLDREAEAHALGVDDLLPRGADSAAVRAVIPEGVDAAIDLVGGQTAREAFDAVRDRGTYVTTVLPSMDDSGVFDSTRGIDLHVLVVHPDRTRLAELLQLVTAGEMTSTIAERFPLAEVAAAHRHQARGGLQGKLILLP